MLVKLDEAFSTLVGRPVLSRGHDVRTVSEQGWGGFKDPKVWPLIVAERAYFITPDKGFGDLRAYPPGSHAGVLVLRPAIESIPAYQRLLEEVLRQYSLERLAGSVTIASPGRIRIRRAAWPGK